MTEPTVTDAVTEMVTGAPSGIDVYPLPAGTLIVCRGLYFASVDDESLFVSALGDIAGPTVVVFLPGEGNAVFGFGTLAANAATWHARGVAGSEE